MATTEIDTYLPTLSLHDALPILAADFVGALGFRGDVDFLQGIVQPVHFLDDFLQRRFQRVGQFVDLRHVLRCLLLRSEEHTSELQSLMRISYAVFCLKKKNKTIREQSLRARQKQQSQHK